MGQMPEFLLMTITYILINCLILTVSNIFNTIMKKIHESNK